MFVFLFGKLCIGLGAATFLEPLILCENRTGERLGIELAVLVNKKKKQTSCWYITASC